MDRRIFVAAAAGVLMVPAVLAQLHQPLALRLVRRTGWQQLMGANQCVIGDMYVTKSDFPISDVGTKLANALELAYRNDIGGISSIPPGIYPGGVRTDGAKGWRIELRGTETRTNVQIHIGNRTSDSIGCILLGMGNSTDTSCNIAGSAASMKALRDSYADSSNARQVVLRIQQ